MESHTYSKYIVDTSHRHLYWWEIFYSLYWQWNAIPVIVLWHCTTHELPRFKCELLRSRKQIYIYTIIYTYFIYIYGPPTSDDKVKFLHFYVRKINYKKRRKKNCLENIWKFIFLIYHQPCPSKLQYTHILISAFNYCIYICVYLTFLPCLKL